MPNRVIREGILDSDRVNILSWAGEVFYRRLHQVVDDYGCFDGRITVLRSKLFPLRLDKVSSSDVEKFLRECVEAGLVRCYEHEDKPYLEVLDFNQTLDVMKRRYPSPEGEVPVTIEKKPIKSESENRNRNETREDARDFEDFILKFNSITGRHFRGGPKEKKSFRARVRDGFKLEEMLKAVANCFSDPWHSQNPNHLTPEFILRPDKLEKYLNYIQTNGKNGGNHTNGAVIKNTNSAAIIESGKQYSADGRL